MPQPGRRRGFETLHALGPQHPMPLLCLLLRGGRGALLLELDEISFVLCGAGPPIARTGVVRAMERAMAHHFGGASEKGPVFGDDSANGASTRSPGACVVGH